MANFNLPVGADPNRDTPWGTDELGFPQFRTASGTIYSSRPQVVPQRQSQPGTMDRAIEVAKGYVTDALQGLLGAATAPRRALEGGDGVTPADALNLAGMLQLGGAASPKPRGALGANSLRTIATGRPEVAIHRSAQNFGDIDLSKSADGTFWMASPEANWDNIVTTGKGFEHRFYIDPNAKLASWDDIDKYSVGELENMGFDGVRMDDGAGDVTYQIWNTNVLSRQQSLPTPRNEAEAMARQILEMRAQGRAKDVTDAMMAQADPQYMYANTPLPMDEASRMARAQEMGFDTGVPLYHGSDAWKIEAFDPSKGMERLPATFFSESRDVAKTYGDVGEFFTRTDYPAEFDFYGGSRIDFNNENLTPGGLVRQVKQAINDAERYGADTESDLAFDLQSAGVDPWYADEIDAVKMRNVVDSFGWDGEPANNLAVFDPTKIRRTTARFDPEFSHLANLSAANVSPEVGLLAQQSTDADKEAILRYLGAQGLLR